MEVVDKTDINVESNEEESKVNVDGNPEIHSKSGVQIIKNDEETSDLIPQKLNKSDNQSINNTIVQYAFPDGTICKTKKFGKWKDWVNLKGVGAEQPILVKWNKIL